MKNTISLLAIIFFATSLNAQDFNYGVGVGPSFTTVTNLEFNNPTTPKGVGFFFYGFGNYDLNEKLSIDTKFGYDHRKVSYKLGFGSSTDELRTSISYLTLNPMLKVDLGAQADKGAYFKSGIRISQLLSAKERNTDTDIKESFKGTNFAFNFGFGIDINEYVGFELIFDYGLTDEVKDSDSDKRLLASFFLININLEKLITK